MELPIAIQKHILDFVPRDQDMYSRSSRPIWFFKGETESCWNMLRDIFYHGEGNIQIRELPIIYKENYDWFKMFYIRNCNNDIVSKFLEYYNFNWNDEVCRYDFVELVKLAYKYECPYLDKDVYSDLLELARG